MTEDYLPIIYRITEESDVLEPPVHQRLDHASRSAMPGWLRTGGHRCRQNFDGGRAWVARLMAVGAAVITALLAPHLEVAVEAAARGPGLRQA